MTRTPIDKLPGNEPNQEPAREPGGVAGNRPAADRPLSKGEVLEYLSAMLPELRDLAMSARLGFLSYLIDTALEEACFQSTTTGRTAPSAKPDRAD
jgi:hypothetical protein